MRRGERELVPRSSLPLIPLTHYHHFSSTPRVLFLNNPRPFHFQRK